MTKASISSQRVVITSFLVDVSDVVLNIIVALLSGSVVMLVEGLQGFVDLVTSGFLLIGLRSSQRRSNKWHRFGYGREVYFWTLMSSIIMLTLTATASIAFGVQRILNPAPIFHIPMTLGLLIIGITSNGYAFSLSYKRLRAPHPRQRFLKTFFLSDRIETKATLILDLMGMLSAVFGLLAISFYAITGDSRFDGIGAILIGGLIAILSVILMAEVKDLLVGRSADPHTEQRIKRITRSFPRVIGVMDLRTMYIGSDSILVNMEINVRKNLDTRAIEELTDRIKARIQRQIPTIKHIQIEIESAN